MASKLTGAGPDDYDGVLYEELHFDVIVWPNPDHIRKRSQRTGNPGAIDLEPEWQTKRSRIPLQCQGPGDEQVKAERPRDRTVGPMLQRASWPSISFPQTDRQALSGSEQPRTPPAEENAPSTQRRGEDHDP